MMQAFSLLLAVALAAALVPGAAAAPADPPVAAAAAPVGDRLAALAPERPLPRGAGDRRCTADLAHCITLANYIPDVCRTIEAAATVNAIDPHFFARLIWKESLFDAAAVSPAGAQGIAQFMPGTAKLRGLADAFNPAAALVASAAYLSELALEFGNIGLAAAAYNGGEARVERFLSGTGGLAPETRVYVSAITGHPVETWRDQPPEVLDLTLDKAAAFQPACIAQAAGRSLREFRSVPELKPWGVVVASNREIGGAERQAARLRNRYAGVLASETVSYTRGRAPGMPRLMHFAQIGRASRAEADALCGRLRAAGGDCMVLRN